MEFFRFPHTPHVAWLGEGQPRDDKVLSPAEADAFLDGEVVVEEKMDGANIGFSIDHHAELVVQNRGSYIDRAVPAPQFRHLFSWLAPHEDALREMLFPHLMLFGEWCYAVHSIRYAQLPDWFLVFDVYDRDAKQFWSTVRRDALARSLGLATVPQVGQRRYSLQELIGLLGPSHHGSSAAEGVYIRREDQTWLLARAKLVRAEFTQSISEHWSRRALESNLRASGGASWR